MQNDKLNIDKALHLGNSTAPSLQSANLSTKSSKASNAFDRLPPVSDMQNYIAAVNSVPILTKEEEDVLCDEFYNKQNVKAGNLLLLSHLRLVVKMAFGFKKYCDNMQDLIAEGNLGLLKALKKFSIEKEVRFATYAILWIRASMQDFVFKNKSIVRSITTNQDKSIVFNAGKINDSQQDDDAYMNYFGVSKGKAQQVLQNSYKSDVSIDGETGADFLNIDQSFAESHNPITQYNQKQALINAKQSLSYAMSKLDERSRMVIHARYISQDKQTLLDISRGLGVSVERVRQIEVKALQKLKEILA
jgi:RNA polymerase sigma-32 factor